MKLPLKHLVCSAVSTLSFITLTQAAFVPLGTSGDDPLNYGSFTDAVLDSVTLNGQTYGVSSLVQISLTAYNGATASVLLQQNGGPTNPSAQERRDFLETDWRGDTGIINPSINAGSVQADFGAPVRNIPGVDMFFYEINGATTGDPFDITINGTSMLVSGSDYGDSGQNTMSADVLGLGFTPATLTAVLNSTATLGTSNIAQNILGVGIDFSDFGVALGDTISSFSYDSNASGSTVDPVIIAAVPEPHTCALIFGFLAMALAAMRRRCLKE